MPPIEKDGGYLNILMRVSEGTITPPEVRVGQSSGIVADTSQSSGTRVLSGLKTKLNQAMAGTASKLRGSTKPTVPWHIPAELSAIAMKALAKNKADRYQTVEALRKDIERFQEGRSVSAKDDTKTEMLWKFAKRNKGFSAGAVATFLVLLCSLWFIGKAWLATNRAYAAYQKEQEDKQARMKESVPAFLRSAQLSLPDRHFDDALKQARVALDYAPDNAEARLLNGQLLVVQQQYAQAVDELSMYLKQKPGDRSARELLDAAAGPNRTTRPAQSCWRSCSHESSSTPWRTACCPRWAKMHWQRGRSC